MLKVITPTGGRPEALKLLNTYLERQTFQDFEWIVLDDCEPVSEIPSRCDKFIQSTWVWHGENTQHRSMLRLLGEINDDDQVVICEDDDWYHKDYLQKTSELLKDHDLVGEKYGVYYNVKNQTYREQTHKNHSSLCQTALKGKAVDVLRKICRDGDKPIDITLWSQFKGFRDASSCVVGIKGMQGRGGIGIGHKQQGTKDDWSYLESLIGDDVHNYKKRYFICASGGSLTQEDIDYIKGKGTVIVINNTFQLAPWANMLYACDAAWWKAYPEAMEFKGRKASVTFKSDRVELWPMNGSLNGLGDEVIHTCGNSGHQAINLAYLEGAKEIILLGYDMQVTKGLNHWHGNHKRGLLNKECYKGWIAHMNILAQQIKAKGVKVINASRETALTCFERKKLEDIC